jgi:MarR family transcriptional regulator, organic hydroperoxide resistance regulator
MPGRKKTIASTFDNLRRVVQVVQGHSKRAEQVAGLTGPQLWAIKVLSESAPIMVSDLARRMYLHPSTVIGILDRLETRGLVRRTRSTEDRRVVTVALTRKGKDAGKKVPAVAQGLLLTGLEELSDADLRLIAGGMELLVGILGARRMPPQLLFSEGVNAPSGGVDPESEPGDARILAASKVRKSTPR